MTGKHDTEIEVGIENGSSYLNASYAFSNNMFVTVGGLAWANRKSTAQFGEFGLGLYKAKDNTGLSLGLNAGYGVAQVYWEDLQDIWWNPWMEQGSLIDVTYARFSCQPGYYHFKNNFAFSFAMRNSVVHWINPTEFNEQPTGTDFFLDPVISIRNGTSMTKFFAECSLQIPVTRSFHHPNIPIHLGIGIAFCLSKGNIPTKSE